MSFGKVDLSVYNVDKDSVLAPCSIPPRRPDYKHAYQHDPDVALESALERARRLAERLGTPDIQGVCAASVVERLAPIKWIADAGCGFDLVC